MRRHRAAVLVAVAACGRFGFDPPPSRDAAADDGAMVDDGAAADSFVSGGFVHRGAVGIATCGTALIVQATTAVPVGATLVVRVVLRDAVSAGTPSASDDAGNIYSIDVLQRHENTRVVVAVLAAHVTTELFAGQRISVMVPSASASAVVVDSFDGIAATNRVSTMTGTGGFAQTFGVDLQTAEDGLLQYCVLGYYNLNGVTNLTWTPTTTQLADCGGASSETANRGGLRFAETAGTHRCGGDLMTSQSIHFAIATVAYRPR